MENAKKKPMELWVECESCKKKFVVTQGMGPNSLTSKKEFKVNGQSIFLTYYDCPSCDRRHYVQIDDLASLSKLKEVTKEFTKLSILMKKGKSVSRKQSANFKKIRKDLSDYRIKLMKEYTDRVIHNDETNSDFVLRFSV